MEYFLISFIGFLFTKPIVEEVHLNNNLQKSEILFSKYMNNNEYVYTMENKKHSFYSDYEMYDAKSKNSIGW